MHIRLPENHTPLITRAAKILDERIRERTGLASLTPLKPDVMLEIEPSIGTEGYRLADGENGSIRIIGNDERGVLYGVGRFLRNCTFGEGEFVAGSWRGASVPQRPVRGMYFATHFHNFYHDAPLAEVERYVEDLALWGCNALSVWYDMHHYAGIDDPQAQAMIQRLHAILKAGNEVGMGAGLTTLANEAYHTSPEAMRAVDTGCGFYHVELCPNQPGAMELILKWRQEMLDAFAGLNIEYVWIWPYDQGGCSCEQCRPWGANGFLKVGEPVARLVRQTMPQAAVILSTWCFDYKFPGEEYAGLAKAFADRPDWVDYLMVDSHGAFPQPVLDNGPAGGLPVLGFPEISMIGMHPWGGFGANPLPERFQGIWDQCKAILSGGFPYSEGIFEDLNKVLCLQWYWDAQRPATDIVREYATAEFGAEVALDVIRATKAMEAAHSFFMPQQNEERGAVRLLTEAEAQGKQRPTILAEAEERLAPQARQSWRWRILRLREELDLALAQSGGIMTDEIDAALWELTRIYYAEEAEIRVVPPTLSALRRLGRIS